MRILLTKFYAWRMVICNVYLEWTRDGMAKIHLLRERAANEEGTCQATDPPGPACSASAHAGGRLFSQHPQTRRSNVR